MAKSSLTATQAQVGAANQNPICEKNPTLSPAEPSSVIKLLDENINHPNRIVLVDPVLQAFRKQRRLATIHPIKRRFIRFPANHKGIIFTHLGVFTQPGSLAAQVHRNRANLGHSSDVT